MVCFELMFTLEQRTLGKETSPRVYCGLIDHFTDNTLKPMHNMKFLRISHTFCLKTAQYLIQFHVSHKHTVLSAILPLVFLQKYSLLQLCDL